MFASNSKDGAAVVPPCSWLQFGLDLVAAIQLLEFKHD
jgi:hypothetical protein